LALYSSSIFFSCWILASERVLEVLFYDWGSLFIKIITILFTIAEQKMLSILVDRCVRFDLWILEDFLLIVIYLNVLYRGVEIKDNKTFRDQRRP
jgi:hypothetical protein